MDSQCPSLPVSQAARSVSLNAPFPEMAGGWKKEQSVFVIRIRYFHLLESPCVKAEYAACGWLVAYFESFLTSLVQALTLALTRSLVNSWPPIAEPRYSLPSLLIWMPVPENLSTASACINTILHNNPCFVRVWVIAKLWTCHHCRRPHSLPPAAESSANHTCFTSCLFSI